MELTTNRAKPWHHAGHRILEPFTVEGDQYCLHCKEWDSGERDARYEGNVYASKTWCRKCGTVINYAVYDGGGSRRQYDRAQRWATSKEPVGPEGT